jgi:hypothetical protein
MMAQVKPPRAAFINFPLGRPCGRANDGVMQKGILREALTILETSISPGEIVDLPYEWDEPFDWPYFMQSLKQMLEMEEKTIQPWQPTQ